MPTDAAVIAWTPGNWITIVLMALGAFIIASTIARIVQQRQQKAAAA